MPYVRNHAQNILLHLLAETGIGGGALLIATAALWLADLRRVRFDLEWWWLAALLATLSLHSLLEFPLWYAYFLGVAAIAVGLGSQRALPVRHAGGAWIARFGASRRANWAEYDGSLGNAATARR